jgi:hypothetical protein
MGLMRYMGRKYCIGGELIGSLNVNWENEIGLGLFIDWTNN